VETPLPPDRKRNRTGKKRRKKNGHPHPGFDLRTEAYKLFGVDVTQIPGLEDNDISGGKLLWRGVRTVKIAPAISFAWQLHENNFPRVGHPVGKS